MSYEACFWLAGARRACITINKTIDCEWGRLCCDAKEQPASRLPESFTW